MCDFLIVIRVASDTPRHCSPAVQAHSAPTRSPASSVPSSPVDGSSGSLKNCALPGSACGSSQDITTIRVRPDPPNFARPEPGLTRLPLAAGSLPPGNGADLWPGVPAPGKPTSYRMPGRAASSSTSACALASGSLSHFGTAARRARASACIPEWPGIPTS